MRAMILAAGRGKRLQPLTDHCPKPLIKVGGKPLIEYHIERLKKAGITEVVINLAYLGDQIKNYLQNGDKWGVQITYSEEAEALEVGGGIFNALPLLGSSPFVLVNGDIWTDYPFEKLPNTLNGLAHLVLVDNPDHNPQGDFMLEKGNPKTYTYAGIAMIHPALFKDSEKGRFPLPPLLYQAAKMQRLGLEYYPGTWMDIGTVERWQQLENSLI